LAVGIVAATDEVDSGTPWPLLGVLALLAVLAGGIYWRARRSP
jgi:hypothetical protein